MPFQFYSSIVVFGLIAQDNRASLDPTRPVR